jgi:hypothetical protein
MKKNDILLILIPSFIFVLAWIGFSIYHNVITSTISDSLSIQITPITSSFDINTIDSLKNREKVIPIYELSVAGQNVVQPASPSAGPINVTPTPTMESSTQTQQATSGGSLTQ